MRYAVNVPNFEDYSDVRAVAALAADAEAAGWDGFFLWDHILPADPAMPLVDTWVALAAIAARISEFGVTPNRVAALGENLILLVNLAWSAWLYACFLRHRGSFAALERWQTAYLPVYSLWAALVVVTFPPLFGYI